MIETAKGAKTHEHSLDHAVEFFSKAGSAFVRKEMYHGTEESALSLFQKTWIVDKELSFKLLLWLTDCRGGAGNRSGFRSCLNWLAENDSEWISANISKIPEIGRWDDLVSLYGTPCESVAIELWATTIHNKDGLACKWADRRDKKLIKYFIENFFTENESKEPQKHFRKFLAKNTKVVESQMCSNHWNEITYQHVPSKAMANYSNTFGKHDPERFAGYKEKLSKGETTINASNLFPHDCVKTALNGDTAIADAQFAAIPNYLEETNKRVICICDSSGSMQSSLSDNSSSQLVHVSMGLSLYFSEKIGKDNPFYRKFMEFESESKLTDWENKSFSEVLNSFNGACGSTNIESALDGLLKYGKMFKATSEQMPNVLLIASDMQFDDGCSNPKIPVVKACMKKWEDAGFEIPTIIYWCLTGYAGSPDIALSKNVALVSGYSPATMKAILSCEDLTPKAVMLKALEKYEVNIPV